MASKRHGNRVVAYFKALSQYFPGGIEDGYEITPRSRSLVRDSKAGTPGYKAGMLTTRLLLSLVTFFSISFLQLLPGSTRAMSAFLPPFSIHTLSSQN